MEPIRKLGFATYLQCLACGEKYPFEQLIEEQGSVLVNLCYNVCMGPLDVRYDYEAIAERLRPGDIARRPDTYWKLAELLPANRQIVAVERPFTPLVRADKLSAELGVELYLKLDCHEVHPTRSFKDRPVAMAFNVAVEAGYKDVYVASTGNLAIASAHLAAKTGIHPLVYIPETLGDQKKNAIRQYMEHPERDLYCLPVSYDDTNVKAMQDCAEANDRAGREGRPKIGFVPNNSFRPFYKEGSKTNGFETAFQLDPVVEPGRRVHIIYPLGSGALLCCAHKGIEELRRLGLFEGHPVMWGAQPETVAPIIRTWERIAGRKAGGETYKEILPTEEIEPVLEPQEKTIAKSIAIGKPGSGYEVLDIFEASGGGGWTATEEEIFDATMELYEKEGIYSQFVGGVTLCGVRKGVERGDLKPGDLVVANITGSAKDRVEDDMRAAAACFGRTERFERVLKGVSGR
ncbi:MAG: pyridoxal-phosphate dependent enzyme [Myxococcales bacterium]|nr:pyridoxal-phosphate dependent enzyme [Myxococcales bacterium]